MSNPTDRFESLPESLNLRDDLALHDQEGNSAFPSVVLESLSDGKYYRLGQQEFHFVKQLIDGPNVKSALQNQPDPINRLNEAQALKLCNWLHRAGLTSDSVAPASTGSSISSLFSQFFFMKIPLCNPEPLLRAMNRRLGWMVSWQAHALGLILALISTLLVFTNWEQFTDSYTNLLNPWRGAWLALAWLILKIVHELAHGLTCKRYGGTVPKAGVALIVLMPIAFVDVSSCWKFRSRWKRLHVTLAGVLTELAIAGLAMVVWTSTDSLLIRNAAADLILLASVSSILFNLNPLLKFDGYFALSDLTAIDNLYQLGQKYARYFGSRYVLGLNVPQPALPEGHSGWIKCYALAASLWRVVTQFGILAGAALLFAGAGVVMAIAGFVAFAVLPLLKLLGHLVALYRAQQLQAGRLLLRVSLLSGIVVGSSFLLPAEIARMSPGIVEYDPPSLLKAPADGFLETIHVDDGQEVVEGQPLFSLRNDELNLKLARLATELAKVEQQVRSARWATDSSKLGEFQSERNGLEQQIAEVQIQVKSLQVCAPCSGKVVSRQLKNRLGTYVHQGEEIGAIGRESSKRIKVSLSTWDASQHEQWKHQPARIVTNGKYSWTATISRLESRASEQLAHESLSAANGGSLPVVVKDDPDAPVLCEPRVNGFVTLDSTRSTRLQCGQRCSVGIRCSQKSLAYAIWEYVIGTLQSI